jgi:hypothetical protein
VTMRTSSAVILGAIVIPCAPLVIPSAARDLQSQSLERRITAAGDGAVTFHFAARPGVCGDGERYIRSGRHQYYGSWSNNRTMEPCVAGPVQVRVTLEDGVVNRVQYWVGVLRARDARDLGAVAAPEAARWLLGVASRGNPRASAKAIFPAVLADSAIVWPALLVIAKDSDTRPRSIRREALLFVSRFAAGVVAGRHNDPFAEDDAERSADEELKIHAVFVLSQLPRGEGVPGLLEVARNNPNPRVRSQAFFWLGQSDDPRAIALFESVLRS